MNCIIYYSTFVGSGGWLNPKCAIRKSPVVKLKTQKVLLFPFLWWNIVYIFINSIFFFSSSLLKKWNLSRVILPDPTCSLQYISSVIRTSPHFGCVWLIKQTFFCWMLEFHIYVTFFFILRIAYLLIFH